jgi:hypothetical protein
MARAEIRIKLQLYFVTDKPYGTCTMLQILLSERSDDAVNMLAETGDFFGVGVFGSNLGRDNNCAYQGFQWFSSVPPCLYCLVSLFGHQCFLPNSSQSISHLAIDTM